MIMAVQETQLITELLTEDTQTPVGKEGSWDGKEACNRDERYSIRISSF